MKIAVVGSINMDQVVLSTRIPLKGETVQGERVTYKYGGKGANQAIALARLGADVLMFGKVGDDSNGKNLLNNFKENNVNIDNIEVEKSETSGLAVITLGDNDNTIVVIPGANAKVDKLYIDNHKDALLLCDMVVLQHEIPLETNEYVINFCKENNIKVLLNPAPANKLSKNIVDKVDYLTPNETESGIIFGIETDINSLIKKVEEYKGKLIITCGSNGVLGYVEGKGVINIPIRKSKVVDTTGAGDTFNSAFVYARCKGFDMEEALKFANIASGISVEKLGAQGGMPVLEEVEKEYNK